MGDKRNTSMKSNINVVSTGTNWMNQVENKALGYELAENWMVFWLVFVPIAMILTMAVKQDFYIYKGMTFIFIIALMTVIRKKIKSSLLYLVANISVIVLTAMIYNTLAERIIFVICVVVCFGLSIFRRYVNEIYFFGISTLCILELILIPMYFLAYALKWVIVLDIINFSSINIAVTCILYVYFSRTNRLYEWEGEFIKAYKKRIKKTQMICMSVIIGIIAFFTLVFKLVGLYDLFDDLTAQIYNLFRKGNNTIQTPVNNKVAIHTKGSGNHLNYLRSMKRGGGNSIVGKILSIVMYIVIAALLLFVLYHFLLLIREVYLGLKLKEKQRKEKIELINVVDNIRQNIKNRAEQIKSTISDSINVSNRKKIRKIYHKLIKQYNTKGVVIIHSNTPTEIEAEVKEKLKMNIKGLTELYEKARYSSSKIEDNDVEKMKKLASNVEKIIN